MEIKLNAYNLNSSTVKTNEIQFDTAPPIEVQQLDIAGSDGSKFVASRYGTKVIKILGYITAASQSALEIALDTFKQSILDQENIELVVSYAGGYRQFIGNVSSFIWTKRHHNITFQPFEIEFTVGDPPFAYSVSTIDSDPIYEEAFSAKDFTGNSLSHTLTFEGTAKPKAKWTYLLNTISGQTAQLVFKSKTTGKQMEINGAFTPGDQLEISQEDYSVKLNGFDQDYDGVFPEFERGANELEWQVYGTGSNNSGAYIDQTNISDSSTDLIMYSRRSCGQSFQTGFNGTLYKVSVKIRWHEVASKVSGQKIYCQLLDNSYSTLETSPTTIDSGELSSSYQWFDFYFNTSITSGTTYNFLLSFDYANYPAVEIGSNKYSNGNLITYLDWYESFQTYLYYDMSFKIFLSQNLTNEFNHTSSLKIEYKRLYL